MLSENLVRRDDMEGLGDVCATAARVLAWVDLLHEIRLLNSMESLYDTEDDQLI